MKPTVLQSEARQELDEAAAWYERKRPGLGSEFVSAVQAVVLRLQRNPESGSWYENTRFRFVLVRRFPYVVFYTESQKAIRVIAVAHGRRRPGYWRHREFE